MKNFNVAFIIVANGAIENMMLNIYEEEFYKLKYCSTVVYMVPRA